MRLTLIVLGALALVMFMVVACAAAPAGKGPIAVKRSFAGCTAERGGRQQCCFAIADHEPVCVWTAPVARSHKKGR
jgi:hypothetical protein